MAGDAFAWLSPACAAAAFWSFCLPAQVTDLQPGMLVEEDHSTDSITLSDPAAAATSLSILVARRPLPLVLRHEGCPESTPVL